MLRTPDADELAGLSVEQKRALLAKLLRERSGRPRPGGLCVHQLVDAQARRTPDAPAVSAAGERISYRELDERSNQLGHYLRRLGVGPDQLVGLCVERTVEAVVALVAILKAGGAYAPLDPKYPAERLAVMLADAQMPLILTQDHLQGVLPQTGSSLVVLEEARQAIARESGAVVPSAVSPQNLAYAIFTSGSTGRPKGVLIPHAALVNLLETFRGWLGVGERDAFMSISSLSFDIATLDVFLPLTIGARIHLIAREIATNAREWIAELGRERITAMQATPTGWRMLVEAGWRGVPALATLLTGGEPMPRELALQLRQWGTLWNLYGPTETTIYSTGGKVAPGEGLVSIGRAVANTPLYLLDANLRPVPVGVVGELHIGGIGLARGYLNRPGLTAEKFLPDPFSPVPGARIYRSGDLARFRPDGSLECLGRVDHQVKIRGYRVELGEIESALRRHPGIREVVVLAREDVPGDRRLVAYVVASPAPDPSELQDWLKRSLPEYMIPAHFVPLETIPVTPNGKFDRKALPAPEQAVLRLEPDGLAPEGSLEEALAELWAGALGLDRIGVHDNFFTLGGHSLMATQLLSRIRETLGADLPLRLLFEAPTIAELARHVELMIRAAPEPREASSGGPPEPSLAGLDR